MYHFFIAPEQPSEDSVVIFGSDVRHIGMMLRMKLGEKIMVSADGDWDYPCEIAEIGTEAVQLHILEGRQETRELPMSTTLYQGFPKGEEMELIVQKAVELGTTRVIPVAMHRSIVRPDEKKAAAKQKRWQAIAKAAAKQAGRSLVPEATLPPHFADALVQVEREETEFRPLPHERAEGITETRALIRSVKPGQRTTIMVGPEGGFEETEVAAVEERGFTAVTLGKRIPRTEMAGSAVLSLLMAETEEDWQMEVCLDNAAMTRLGKAAVETADRAAREDYGNPSPLYLAGARAEVVVRTAAEQIAGTLKAEPAELIFTSGGTESDSLAIPGTAHSRKGYGRYLIISAVEHPAVLEAMRFLEE